MKLNFDKHILDLGGNPIQGAQKLGQFLAEMLVMQAEGNVLKHFDWALKLHKGEVIDLDKADKEYLKGFVENHKTTSILVKAQMLSTLDAPSDPPHDPSQPKPPKPE